MYKIRQSDDDRLPNFDIEQTALCKSTVKFCFHLKGGPLDLAF